MLDGRDKSFVEGKVKPYLRFRILAGTVGDFG